MNNKGFTLIELLAVIVILAIIAIIATPIMLNVIDKAKTGASENSVSGYVDAVEKQVVLNQVLNKDLIEAGEYNKEQLSLLNVKVKGENEITALKLRVDSKGQVEEGKFCINNKSIDYDGKKAQYNKDKDYCNSEIKLSGAIEGPIKVEPQTGDTHRGIVYLDPTDLSKICTKEEVEANVNSNGTSTEIKIGCMKWYIYDDSGDNYKMILDHNTTAVIRWYDSGYDKSFEGSYLYPLLQDLKTISGWVVEPSIISAEEINIVTGKQEFDYNNPALQYNLNGSETDFTNSRSKYDWLYNNLNKCKTDSKDNGCSVEDNNRYIVYGSSSSENTCGYWTKTKLPSFGAIWYIYKSGSLTFSGANLNQGIRPVITVPKTFVYEN